MAEMRAGMRLRELTPDLVTVQAECLRSLLWPSTSMTPWIDLDQIAFDDPGEFTGCHSPTVDVGTSRVEWRSSMSQTAILVGSKRGVPSPRDAGIRQGECPHHDFARVRRAP